MSSLRIIELEQQLKRRDGYILWLEGLRDESKNKNSNTSEIEKKIKALPRYFIKEHVSDITYMCGNYFTIEDVLNCFK